MAGAGAGGGRRQRGAAERRLILGRDHFGIKPLYYSQRDDGIAFASELKAVLELGGPDALVVGLPYNMDGTEGPRARDARAFGAELSDVALSCGVVIRWLAHGLRQF